MLSGHVEMVRLLTLENAESVPKNHLLAHRGALVDSSIVQSFCNLFLTAPGAWRLFFERFRREQTHLFKRPVELFHLGFR
jgi:hypothetical protein